MEKEDTLELGCIFPLATEIRTKVISHKAINNHQVKKQFTLLCCSHYQRRLGCNRFLLHCQYLASLLHHCIIQIKGSCHSPTPTSGRPQIYLLQVSAKSAFHNQCLRVRIVKNRTQQFKNKKVPYTIMIFSWQWLNYLIFTFLKVIHSLKISLSDCSKKCKTVKKQ